MASPTPLSLVSEQTGINFRNKKDNFTIFTHSSKTRVIVFGLFLSYLAFFLLFVDFLRDSLRDLHNTPMELAALGNPEFSRLVFYSLSILGLLAALLILLYFMWALADIWGLQIWASEKEIRVQNTITGKLLRRFTGVGAMSMEEILEIKGKRLATFVIGSNHKLRFSPVDQVDVLIAHILANAKNASISD